MLSLSIGPLPAPIDMAELEAPSLQAVLDAMLAEKINDTKLEQTKADPTGEIHGQKWHDLNGDAVRDPGEPGLNGWTIELVDPSDGSVVATAVTADVDLDEDGSINPETEAGLYSFTGLAQGSYEVQEVTQTDWVQTFPLTVPTGELSFVQVLRDGQGGVDGLDSPLSVTVSPDGNHVYAVGGGDGSVTVFSRDEATGQLTFVEMLRDDQGGVDGLYGVQSVTVSPDGDHVYTAAINYFGGVAVFRRDAVTGELDFVQFFRNSTSSLNGARSVTVSPDGNHVYAIGMMNNTMGMYRRDRLTGKLTFVQILRDGQDGVDGLDGAESVTVSPDGKHVYTASSRDDAVAVFSRDGVTGELNFVQILRDGQGGVDGLARAYSVTVSPDSNHVYVAAAEDNAVSVFSRVFVAGPYQVLLSPDEILTGLDFGNYKKASISGQTFEDLNGNSVRDSGEPGLDGWPIELVDPATGTVIDTRVTASVDLDDDGTIDPETEAGLYSFDDLAPGSYEVREVVGEGYLQTYPSPPTYSLTPMSGDVIAAINFGNVAYGSISGQVFEDSNGDRVHDAGEPGLNGWTIELIDPATGTAIDTRVTASVDLDEDGTIDPQTETGLYSFESLLPGSYEVREVAWPGWAQTSPNPASYSIMLAYGQDLAGQDFGNQLLPGEIHGTKWNDLNGNGRRDTAEPGLAGWTIYLDENENGQLDPFERRTVTLEDDPATPENELGTYVFDNLQRQDYTVREVARVDWRQTYPVALSFLEYYTNGQQGVTGLNEAYGTVVSPDGNHLYAVGRLDDSVVVFARDAETGRYVRRGTDRQSGRHRWA